MKKKLKIKNRKEWDIFTLGYLHLSELACLEIIQKKHKDNDFSIESIYIPAIFSLKHGIEVMLKLFSIEFFNKDTIDQDDYSHDIEEIFSKLRKNISETRLKAAILKYEKSYPGEERSLSGKSVFSELEKIVKKYYNLTFFRDVIGTDYSIVDCDNTALKYPSNSLSLHIDYEKIVKKFKMSDVTKTLIDVVQLEKIFYQLYLILYSERK